MKIIIVGSESFIGKEVARQCKERGIECIGFDLPHNILDPKFGDILPQADALVHLSAISRTNECEGKMYETFNVNVMGALNVLRASRAKGIPQFIFASSDWVYPDGESEMTEDTFLDITKAPSEYSLSKMVAEIALKKDTQKHGGGVTICRFAITYGPRPKEKIWVAVESIASTVKHQDSVTVGSLKTGRRFIHVQDLAAGILSTIGTKGYEVFNLAGQSLVTTQDIITASEKVFGKKVEVKETGGTVSVRNPSGEKARNMLGWSPKISLEEGIRSVEHYL